MRNYRKTGLNSLELVIGNFEILKLFSRLVIHTQHT